MVKFVDIETPYWALTEAELIKNVRYARACVRDSLLRGEIPFASHLLYTQTGIRDDNISEEREMGINAGKEIANRLEATTVVYADLGISRGMQIGIEMAIRSYRRVEYRKLGDGWEEEFVKHEDVHSHRGVW